MLMNLLTSSSLPEGYREVNIPTAALYALIGFAVVFAGIIFLIAVVWLVGKLLSNSRGNTKPIEKKVQAPVQVAPALTPVEEVDEETVAVIMAALTAYYETNYPKCEFTVKRIKRIRRNDYA